MTDIGDSKKLTDPHLGPVESGERISVIDSLRGVALLGILSMNIYFFAMPGFAYFSPRAYGGAEGLNLVVWAITNMFCNLKFMAIFSMLFGAGFLIMSERAESRGVPVGPVYYRRTLWLLVIGLIHSYLIWIGDILVPYAVCGLLLFLFRKLSAKGLLISAVIVLSVGFISITGGVLFFDFARTQSQLHEEAVEAGEKPEDLQVEMHEAWTEIKTEMFTHNEDIEEEVEAYRGGYTDILKFRIPRVIEMQTMAIPFYLLWRAGGLMLLGMSLLRRGILSGQKSQGFYLKMMILGYALGLPLTVYDSYFLYTHEFDQIYKIGLPFNYVGSIAVALGHVGLVMLISKSGWLNALMARLAAVGRMALTNYLMQSILCTTFFYGYGLGFYGHLERATQFLVVFAVWILQLIYSPIWLKHFRFGPAEWLWRSLTYWKIQRFRKEA